MWNMPYRRWKMPAQRWLERPLIALNKAVQLMQIHRGLSASMLSGDEGLGARRPAVRDALVKALAHVDERFASAKVPTSPSKTEQN